MYNYKLVSYNLQSYLVTNDSNVLTIHIYHPFFDTLPTAYLHGTNDTGVEGLLNHDILAKPEVHHTFAHQKWEKEHFCSNCMSAWCILTEKVSLCKAPATVSLEIY